MCALAPVVQPLVVPQGFFSLDGPVEQLRTFPVVQLIWPNLPLVLEEKNFRFSFYLFIYYR